MAILNILHYPDPRLHTVAAPVESIDDEIRALVRNMGETMYAAPGIGLAATQVNVHKQVVVMDTSESRNHLRVMINPRILAKSGVLQREEGCLSVPGIYETVQRAEFVTVQAQNLDGETLTLEADGLLAVCIQHEIDHLNGRVFVEYLSQLKQTRIRNKLKKLQRETM
ncbi:MAG: peptide deformylase [Sulfuricellaceae bacterium]